MPRPAAAGAHTHTHTQRLRSISALRYINYALLPYTYMQQPIDAY